MIHLLNQRYFQRKKLNCDVLPLILICVCNYDVRKKSVKTTQSKTHLFAEYVPHQITKHKDLNTLNQKVLTYSQYYVTVSLSYRFPYQISLTFPGSPKPSQRAPLRHSKCHESQEDIWYLWYHMLGSCQWTTTCQKDFTEERQNYKRLAKGPLSTGF